MTDSRVDKFTRGEDLAVDLAAIEKELTSLWKAAQKGSGDGKAVATRACLWNLIVHSPGMEESETLRSGLEAIYPSTPMRTLLLEVERGAEPPLSAWVSARCHLAGKGRVVCSEEVTIRCDTSVTERLGPLVNALQVPDVPAAAWWPDLDHDPTALCAHFVELVDRIVVDTSTVPGSRGLKQLIALTQLRHAHRSLFGDLAWHRIAPWRSLTARLFDAAIAALLEADRIVIRAGGRAGQPAGSQALLYGGWLASRLGWRPDGTGWTRRDGGRVEFCAEHGRGSGSPGDLLAVNLHTTGGDLYCVERTADGLLHARAPHLGEADRAFLRLRPYSSAEYLQRELGPLGDDPVMWQSVDSSLL